MTAEEFFSLLEVEKQKAYDILRPQIHPERIFDDSSKCLVAYALMPVNKEYFWKYDYILNFSESHSAVLFNLKGDLKKSTGVYHQDSSVQEKIEKGYYKYNLISFTCEYDFNEWNILT